MKQCYALFPVLTVLVSCSASNGEAGSSQSAPPAQCQPIETRPPNGAGQQPAFAGQTRICEVKSNVNFEVVVLARGLAHPWAIEPLPNGDLLVTERPGRMRVVSASGTIGDPISGLPAIDARGQGGLLDVALSPAFPQDRTIYWAFTEPGNGGNSTAIARGVLSGDARSLSDVRVIFSALPKYNNTMHFGSRLAFGPDGKLYATFGERSDASMRMHAQRLDNHLGKTIRINPDGSAPADNPFVNEAGALKEIWTYGHRNAQAAAFDPQGRYWAIEHGARGGDELNLIEKGKNYGWPIQAYGQEYSGQPIRTASTTAANVEQPRYYWDPVIAPSGAQFYTGNLFPAWRNSLFIGGMASQRLVRVVLEGTRVTGEEHLLRDRAQRVRDVRQGGDGALYIVTDEDNGEVWKLVPRR